MNGCPKCKEAGRTTKNGTPPNLVGRVDGSWYCMVCGANFEQYTFKEISEEQE